MSNFEVVGLTNNALTLYRAFTSGASCLNVDTWVPPEDKQILSIFFQQCQDVLHLSIQDVMGLHSDDLFAAFNKLNVPWEHRTRIRHAINAPSYTLQNTLFALKVTAVVVAAVWRIFWWWGFRNLVVLGLGVGVGMSFGGRKVRRTFRQLISNYNFQSSSS